MRGSVSKCQVIFFPMLFCLFTVFEEDKNTKFSVSWPCFSSNNSYSFFFSKVTLTETFCPVQQPISNLHSSQDATNGWMYLSKHWGGRRHLPVSLITLLVWKSPSEQRHLDCHPRRLESCDSLWKSRGFTEPHFPLSPHNVWLVPFQTHREGSKLFRTRTT